MTLPDAGSSTHRLRLVTILLIVTVAGISVLALLLAAGWADPPVAPKRVFSADSTETLPLADLPGLAQSEGYSFASLPLEALTAPITLQAGAAFASERSIWGFWWVSSSGATPTQLLIHPTGGYSLSDASASDWSPFLHIHPSDNRLYLHVEANGRAEVRINNELAADFEAGAVENWRVGIVFDRSSPPIWQFIQVNGS